MRGKARQLGWKRRGKKEGKRPWRGGEIQWREEKNIEEKFVCDSPQHDSEKKGKGESS
jgi:hypothetical protein